MSELARDLQDHRGQGPFDVYSPWKLFKEAASASEGPSQPGLLGSGDGLSTVHFLLHTVS